MFCLKWPNFQTRILFYNDEMSRKRKPAPLSQNYNLLNNIYKQQSAKGLSLSFRCESFVVSSDIPSVVLGSYEPRIVFRFWACNSILLVAHGSSTQLGSSLRGGVLNSVYKDARSRTWKGTESKNDVCRVLLRTNTSKRTVVANDSTGTVAGASRGVSVLVRNSAQSKHFNDI